MASIYLHWCNSPSRASCITNIRCCQSPSITTSTMKYSMHPGLPPPQQYDLLLSLGQSWPRLDRWARIQFCGVLNQQDYENQPKTMINHETTLKNHGNQQKTMNIFMVTGWFFFFWFGLVFVVFHWLRLVFHGFHD